MKNSFKITKFHDIKMFKIQKSFNLTCKYDKNFQYLNLIKLANLKQTQ